MHYLQVSLFKNINKVLDKAENFEDEEKSEVPPQNAIKLQNNEEDTKLASSENVMEVLDNCSIEL
jgi:hypothetical protein